MLMTVYAGIGTHTLPSISTKNNVFDKVTKCWRIYEIELLKESLRNHFYRKKMNLGLEPHLIPYKLLTHVRIAFQNIILLMQAREIVKYHTSKCLTQQLHNSLVEMSIFAWCMSCEILFTKIIHMATAQLNCHFSTQLQCIVQQSSSVIVNV